MDVAQRGADAFITRRGARSCMVTVEILPWILATIGWTLAGVGIFFTVYYGWRARRTEERARRTEKKLDSLLRVTAVEGVGQVIDIGGGRTAEVVMLPDGKLGFNYTLTPEPAVVQVKGSSATLTSSKKQQEEE